MTQTVPEMVIPADWVPGPRQGEWTYEDYLKLPNFPVHVEQFFAK